MHILLIGEKNLKNNSISEILSEEKGLRVEQLTPGDLETFNRPNTGYQISCTIADLTSFDTSPLKILAIIRQTVEPNRLVAMHIYKSPKLIEPLLKKGADCYLHFDFDPDELLKIVEAFHSAP